MAPDKQYLEENGKKPGVITTATGVQYKVGCAPSSLHLVLREPPSLTSRPNTQQILRNHTRASIKWEFPPKFEAGGTLVRAGDELIVSYTATTIDGAEIESSYKHGNSTVRIKQNEVLRGLEEVLLLMRVGDEWEVTIPADLAYGDRGRSGGVVKPVPPGAVLIYKMHIVGWAGETKFDAGVALYYFLCAGFGLIFLKAVGMWDVMQDNIYRLIKGDVLFRLDGNTHCYMDVEIDGVAAGRMEFELFTHPLGPPGSAGAAGLCPKTCENFRALCTGERGSSKSGTKLHYKGTSFFRIVGQFMCQGGDITKRDPADGAPGTGTESIYDGTFEDECEHGWVKFSQRGLLAMANSGKNTNNSQFFITFNSVNWLDGKHVVFGRVCGGHNVLDKIEATATARDGTHAPKVIIADCGQLKKKQKHPTAEAEKKHI